jgi:hypothetical protein
MKNSSKEYLTVCNLFDFSKELILEEFNIRINNETILSLKESIFNKEVKSFGNSLIFPEKKAKFYKNCFICISSKFKNFDYEHRIYDSNNIQKPLNFNILCEMKFMKISIDFKEVMSIIDEKNSIDFINSTSNDISYNDFDIDIHSKEKKHEINNKINNENYDKNNINKLDNKNKGKDKYTENDFIINKEINEIYKKLNSLEISNKSQNEEINNLKESLIKKEERITELEKKLDLFEKDFLQLKIINSPLTIRYLYEYFISLVHKKFTFNNRNKFENSNKLNEILESIYYFLKGPNLISSDVDINFIRNLPLDIKNILLEKKENLRNFLKSIQDLYDDSENMYLYNDIRSSKIFDNEEVLNILKFVNSLSGNILNL